MYIKSFKYYLSLYETLPNFDRGVGLFFFPLLIILLIVGIVLSPLLLVQFIYIKNTKSKYKVIEFIFSKNQLKIAKQFNVDDSLFINCITSDKIRKDNKILSNKKLFIISLLNGLEVSITLLKICKNKRLKQNTIRFVKIIALSKLAKYYMKNSKMLLQYNDHSPYNLMLHDVARKFKVKTMYIQHAPVSFKFPPLYHDLNVLFSEDSLVKYKYTSGGNINEQGVLKLFDFRLPDLNHLPDKTPNYILLCFNKLDSLDEIKLCVKRLLKSGFSVKLRPHPADERKFKFDERVSVTKSGDSIWDDLSKAKAIIVNESAVPLESLYYRVPTYKLSKLSKDIKDNYGFIKQGLLLRNYESIEEIITDIKSQKIVWNREKIKYFIGDVENRDNCLKKMSVEINKLIS